MSNNYKQNPIFIDTFNADIDIANQAFGFSYAPMDVDQVRFYNPTVGDKVVLKDYKGNIVVEMKSDVTLKDVVGVLPGHYVIEGLQLKAADCTVTTGNILIYLK